MLNVFINYFALSTVESHRFPAASYIALPLCSNVFIVSLNNNYEDSDAFFKLFEMPLIEFSPLAFLAD
jgi:hypothetical protein